VILQEDAIFTSEPNTGPALRRMKQASVQLAGLVQVKAYLEGKASAPVAPSGPIRLVRPLAVAAVLNGLDDSSIAASLDSHKQEKLARLHELLLIAEWFEIPLYGTTTTLPSSFKGIITKPIRPLSELAQNVAATQVLVAGTDEGMEELVGGMGSRDVFLMEDAVLAARPAADHAALLDGLYRQGIVPTTYKSFYYDMTKSVDPDEWPSKSWLTKFDEYYNKTQAPEDLPPMI